MRCFIRLMESAKIASQHSYTCTILRAKNRQNFSLVFLFAVPTFCMAADPLTLHTVYKRTKWIQNSVSTDAYTGWGNKKWLHQPKWCYCKRSFPGLFFEHPTKSTFSSPRIKPQQAKQKLINQEKRIKSSSN